MTDQALMSLAELEQLQHRLLDLRNNQRSLGNLTDIDNYSCRRHGQGMEVFDTRFYQAGDDIRHIDWRATARTGKTTSKIFHMDHGRKLLLVIDRRKPMFFGTRTELKAATAARTAAALAFAALAKRIEISALVIDNDIRIYPNIRNTSHLIPVLCHLIKGNNSQNQSSGNQPGFNEVLMHNAINKLAGAALFVISDFHDIDYNMATQWLWLGQHYDTAAICIMDKGEQILAPAGHIRIHSDSTGNTHVIDSNNARLRQQYADSNQQQAYQRLTFLIDKNISYNELYTDDELFIKLQHILF